MIILNGVQVKPTIFPDGTSQVWKLDETALVKDDNRIEWRFESEAELIHIAQLQELLPYRVHLYVPYLPYARQDKEVSNNATFALRTFARMLNSMLFKTVTVFDVHSDEALELIDRSKSIAPVQEVQFAFDRVVADLVCYPDSGALSKYCRQLRYQHVSAKKVRDQSSGQILHMELNGSAAGKRVLIVDDICDGGATFTMLADALYEAGAQSVHLYVSHGIFSKGTKVLRAAGIERIFTKEGEVYDTSN